MHLTPREQEKLLIIVAADLARKRRARGLQAELPRGRGDHQPASCSKARATAAAWPT